MIFCYVWKKVDSTCYFPHGSDNGRYFVIILFTMRFLNLNFKIETKPKTAQNRILNMKKGGFRTPSVRFEM